MDLAFNGPLFRDVCLSVCTKSFTKLLTLLQKIGELFKVIVA